MLQYTLAHLSDAVLLRDLAALVAQDRVTTAALLAHIAEVDARRLYVPAGYSSMHAYCVEELRLSEDAAYKRIQAARAARQFPTLFHGLAEGRLHLAAVCLLAPHLTPENSGELIEAATHRRKSEVENWLAGRFSVQGVSAGAWARIRPSAQLAPGQVGIEPERETGPDDNSLAPGQVRNELPNREQLAPGQVGNLQTPSCPERFLVQVTIAKITHAKLRYAQALLSHAVPTGDVAQVLDRALDALIAQLQKRKLGSASARQPGRRLLRRERHGDGAARKRYVPAPVRRAVWERDGGQCTFVSAAGHRCSARRFLEFDHVEPVARGRTCRPAQPRMPGGRGSPRR
jgi:hypothetical protein